MPVAVSAQNYWRDLEPPTPQRCHHVTDGTDTETSLRGGFRFEQIQPKSQGHLPSTGSQGFLGAAGSLSSSYSGRRGRVPFPEADQVTSAGSAPVASYQPECQQALGCAVDLGVT